MTEEQIEIVKEWCKQRITVPMTEVESGVNWLGDVIGELHFIEFEYWDSSDNTPSILFIGTKDGVTTERSFYLTHTPNQVWNIPSNMKLLEAVWDKLNRES